MDSPSTICTHVDKYRKKPVLFIHIRIGKHVAHSHPIHPQLDATPTQIAITHIKAKRL